MDAIEDSSGTPQGHAADIVRSMTESATHITPDRHSFIVRVWREDSADQASGLWRGSIEHVTSGQRLHFISLDALAEFVGHYWRPDQSAEQVHGEPDAR